MKTASQLNLKRVGEIKSSSNRRREGESQLASD